MRTQIDLSEEPLDENIELCVEYLKRMDKINCVLEMELGITGGEEDGVNNEDVEMEKLYSQPEEVDQVYTALSKVSKNFTIAASFGNVHGVYKPGNVKLSPSFLGKHQAFIKEKHSTKDDKPALLVFHGGSGSTQAEILEAIGHGVIKMNIDTDTRTFARHCCTFRQRGRPCLQCSQAALWQVGCGDRSSCPWPGPGGRTTWASVWVPRAGPVVLLVQSLTVLFPYFCPVLPPRAASVVRAPLAPPWSFPPDTEWAYWEGIKDFYKSKEAYLQAQIGNPDGEDKPNKKNYDPRVWLRKAEQSFVKRLTQAFEDLNCSNVN